MTIAIATRPRVAEGAPAEERRTATRERAGRFARRVREEPREPTNPGPRFPIGQLYATPGALEELAKERDFGKPYSVQRANESLDRVALVLPYLRRHAAGDWGDVRKEDAQANDMALVERERLLSAYQLATDERIWIITEADRSSTTVLLPDEY
jgi:hypothetical protein